MYKAPITHETRQVLHRDKTLGGTLSLWTDPVSSVRSEQYRAEVETKHKLWDQPVSLTTGNPELSWFMKFSCCWTVASAGLAANVSRPVSWVEKTPWCEFFIIIYFLVFKKTKATLCFWSLRLLWHCSVGGFLFVLQVQRRIKPACLMKQPVTLSWSWFRGCMCPPADDMQWTVNRVHSYVAAAHTVDQ